ncbi:MAG: hypothetical protein AAF441_27815 [Pseudomonadota bacterium]
MTADSAGERTETYAQGGMPLTAAGQWASPQAHDVHQCNAGRVGRFGTEAGGRNLTDDVMLWPTPRASASENYATRPAPSHGKTHGRTLTGEAGTWPTPAARDGKGANSEDHLENGTGRKHMDQLPNAVEHLWQTPRSHEVGGYQFDRGDKTSPRLTLTGQATASPTPRLDPAMPGDGPSSPPPALTFYRLFRATTCSVLKSERRWLLRRGIRARGTGRTRKGWTRTCSAPWVRPAFRKSLNPLFVEWLQDWPIGWTDCGNAVMGFTLWLARSRTELSRLL